MAEQQFHLRQLQALLQSHAGSPWALRLGTRSHQENQNAPYPATSVTHPDKRLMASVNRLGTPRRWLGLSSMLENHRWFHRETLQGCTRHSVAARAFARLDPAHAADATGSRS